MLPQCVMEQQLAVDESGDMEEEETDSVDAEVLSDGEAWSEDSDEEDCDAGGL